MAAYTVFCSAFDSNVQIVPRTKEWSWRVAMDADWLGDVACLELGVRCTGAACPLLASAAEPGELLPMQTASTPPPL